MLNRAKNRTRRGDTLIEVMFAVGIFGLAAVGTISLMNRGLATAQSTLESTMARQEVDAQAEALRFIHDAYLSEPYTKTDEEEEINCSNITSYRELWKCITLQAYSARGNNAVINEDPSFYSRTAEFGSSCDSLFRANNKDEFSIPNKSFIINPRALGSKDTLKKVIVPATTIDFFRTTATYPRLLYGTASDILSDRTVDNNLMKAKDYSRLDNSEGIWVTAIASEKGVKCINDTEARPDYYDFRIQTCWDSIAGDSASVVSSTIRLFNPDQINLVKNAGYITFDNVNFEDYDDVAPNDHAPETAKGSYCDSDCKVCTNNIANYSEIHTIHSGQDITFSGYTNSKMNEGTRYNISNLDGFLLNVDVDTSEISAHPGGSLTVAIGPLGAPIIEATLSEDGGSLTTASGESFSVGSRFHLCMKKDGEYYEIASNEFGASSSSNDCSASDEGHRKSVTSASQNVYIDFNFQHESHACGCISKATLSGVEMVSLDTSQSATSGCFQTE